MILFLAILLFPARAAIAAGPSVAAAVDALPEPVRANLHQIIDAPPSGWRSPAVELYRWDLFPDILVIDTSNFAVQDRMFTRLAYYLEKRGYRGRLLRNSQLAGRHGWNAHDYGAAGLAAFFTAAVATSFPLNPEELAVRRLSLDQGIIIPSRGGFTAGRGGLLGISRSSSRIERELLLTHESFHGVFFSSSAYREYCQELWDSLPPELKAFYERFLDSLEYDIDDPTLVVNEFQAYLMQQPLSFASSYFERFLRLQERSGAPSPVAVWQLQRNAEELDTFTRARFGFGAGGELLASLGSPAQ
jgi:hypothetical protein